MGESCISIETQSIVFKKKKRIRFIQIFAKRNHVLNKIYETIGCGPNQIVDSQNVTEKRQISMEILKTIEF